MLVALGSEDGRPATWPKIARLQTLTRAGLPVPEGLFAARRDLGDPAEAREVFASDPRISTWLATGPLIVRSAAPDEDAGARSAAGLGRSVAHCRSVDELVDALTQVDLGAEDPWLERYRARPDDPDGPDGPDDPKQTRAPGDLGVLIMRQVEPAVLGVVAVPPGDEAEAYLECHRPDEDRDVFEALAQGEGPAFAGPLSAWAAEVADRVREVVDRACELHADRAAHGLDLEIVVDGADQVWLVQLRPLTASPWPGWSEFRSAMAREREAGRLPDLDGLLLLDAEHNPAPLSPAHAGLIRWLAERRPDAGGLAVVADWLYVRTRVRDLATPRADGDEPVDDATAGAAPPDPVATLARLRDELLPAARARLDEVRTRLRDDPAAIEPAVQTALDAFESMIATYVRELVPARRTHGAKVIEGDRDAATVLRGKAEVLDVLPVTWDVASPSLADALPEAPTSEATPGSLPDTEDPQRAVAQLTEWDDHLFALGLAPLRACYLHVAERSQLEPRRLFGLGPDELVDFAAEGANEGHARLERADARWARVDAHGRLRPPPRLWHGWPIPLAGAGPLRGVAIGEDHEGPLAIRAGLDDLLARAPADDAIVCLPALTAQAAVALDHLGVRAVCTEVGGAMSHGAIMARELGLSALIGAQGCTDLTDGERWRIDVRLGRLRPVRTP